MTTGDEAYPPPFDDLEPLAGYTVAPSSHPGRSGGTQVSIGLEPVAKGIYGFRSVAVFYHVGDRRYVVVVPYAVVACVPKRRYANSMSCETPIPSVSGA